MPFDPMVKRTEATIEGPEGQFKVTKGATHIILDLCANKDAIHDEVDTKVTEYGLRGIRCMAVARTEPAKALPAKDVWNFIGVLTFLDPPREDTKQTIEDAMENGVDVKMVTGDNVLIARETARVLGMGTNIATTEGLPCMGPNGELPKDLHTFAGKIIEADGFAQVFPEHKYLIVEALRQAGFATGMTGDGVNDAPALKRADVGIAVSGATDAARAAADIVLTEPGLNTVVHALIIARQIFRRINNFINYRVAATLQLLCFFFVAVFAFPPNKYEPGTLAEPGPGAGGLILPPKPSTKERHDTQVANITTRGVWPHFFQIPVLMLMLITVLNDGTLIAIGYDNVIPSPRPDKWNLRAVFFIAAVLGGVAMLSSLLLLWGCLDQRLDASGAAAPGLLFKAFGLPAMPYEKIITAIYLKVSISDFLTLFSSRTTSWFWTSMPAIPLLAAACVALLASTMLGTFWPAIDSPGGLEGLPVTGLANRNLTTEPAYANYRLWPLWVWIYCIVWWFVQDAAKVAAWRFLYRFDVFQVSTGAMVNMRGASKFKDRRHPLARVSAGLVEEKLLDKKLANAEAALASDPAARAGMALARTSLGRGSDGRGRSAEEVRRAFERVSAGMLPESQASAAAHMDQVRRATESLQRVSAAYARQSMEGPIQRGVKEAEKNTLDRL
jgi:H+-transporting ATPase